jgi:PTS system mannose-specific IIA component
MTHPLVGVVVVTHGQLAAELLNAAEMIVGELPQFSAVSIGWHDDVELAHEEIARAIGKVDMGRGVLVLTDMFGGTASNLGLSFLEAGRIEVITGVNLPMLIRLAKSTGGEDIEALAHETCEHGRVAIRVASDLLRAEREPVSQGAGAPKEPV